MDKDKLVVKLLGMTAIKKIVKNADIPWGVYEKLYSIYYDEMPYGTMKARTGDPQEFIFNRLCDIVQNKKRS